MHSIIITVLITLSLNLLSQVESQPTEIPPEWAREAIWYQIYPERFWNGDKTNDPDREDILTGWPYRASENWQIYIG